MLQTIIQRISEEYNLKFLTKISQNTFGVASKIWDPTNILELEIVIKNYFNNIMLNSSDNFNANEAMRILNIFNEYFRIDKPELKVTYKMNRIVKDDISDLYIDSLVRFVSAIDEPVLFEHIRYLDKIE